MSDNLKMYDMKYTATVLGTVQVEAVNYMDARIKARDRLREGFPREPESEHHIEAVTIAAEDKEE